MSFVRLVALEGKPCDGPLRLCSLPARKDLPILPTPTPMSEAHTSTPGSHAGKGRVAQETQRTTLVLELDHTGDLPADLADKIGQRIYDFCSTKGVTVSPTVRVWYELKVREQA